MAKDPIKHCCNCLSEDVELFQLGRYHYCERCAPEFVSPYTGEKFRPDPAASKYYAEVLELGTYRKVRVSLRDKGTFQLHSCCMCGVLTREPLPTERGPTCNACFNTGNMGILVYGAGVPTQGKGRKIGIEVECLPVTSTMRNMYEWRDENNRHMVSSTVDGSLRGKYKQEFMSPILTEENYVAWVDKFCSMLDAKVYNRCGLHIHLSTEDFGWADIARLANWAKIHENRISSMVSPSRRLMKESDGSGRPLSLPVQFGKRYCERETLLEMLYGAGLSEGCQTSLKRNGICPMRQKRANDREFMFKGGLINRYQWINLHGHFHKKAIEIRIHQGTCNPTKIKNWIGLWLSILKAVLNGDMRGPLAVAPKHISLYYANVIKNWQTVIKNWQTVIGQAGIPLQAAQMATPHTVRPPRRNIFGERPVVFPDVGDPFPVEETTEDAEIRELT